MVVDSTLIVTMLKYVKNVMELQDFMGGNHDDSFPPFGLLLNYCNHV